MSNEMLIIILQSRWASAHLLHLLRNLRSLA